MDFGFWKKYRIPSDSDSDSESVTSLNDIQGNIILKLPFFYRGWIMAMRHWLASRPACLTVSSLSSTRLPGLLLDFDARAPERIKFKLVVIVYRALHGAAPQYLSDQLQYVADLPTRCRGRLRSSTSNLLDVRPSRCVTVGDQSFATAGPRLWNSLPADIRSASSLTTFCQNLKTYLFRQSYPDIVL